MDAEDTLVVEDPSMCPEEFKVKMEQAFFGPLDADTDETRFAPQTSPGTTWPSL